MICKSYDRGSPVIRVASPIQDDTESSVTSSLGKSRFQKLLWVHRLSKPTIDFLEMPSPMGESLCHLVIIDVKQA